MAFSFNKLNTASIRKTYLPYLILAVFISLTYLVLKNPPQASRGAPSTAPQLSVEVQTLTPKTLPIKISSYGTVKPRTQSILLPQASGQINYISENFREGGFFEANEVLVKLDDRDYLAEIDIATAAMFSAEQALSEEQARVEQAMQDWQRLGKSETAPDLVLRKPQLLAAQAKVYSAKATLAKAQLALERTAIKAPYTGRILAKQVDLGQVVSMNTQLAEIYATDYVEIRLPIKNNDLPFMVFPESNRNNEQTSDQPDVAIYSDLIDRQQWQGKIVRTEGAFDTNSQQLFVVAQINDPYGVNDSNILPIKIGQYVTAQINGKTINNAITVPNKAIYQGSYVYLVVDGVLKRKNINIAWQNNEFSLLKFSDEKSAIQPGDLLVLTALGQVNSGTPVDISKIDGKPVIHSYTGQSENQHGRKDTSGKKEKRSKPEQGSQGAEQ